jgi:hypothetical protein
LEANKIPPRQAYRLIQRYLRMQRIWDTILVTNEALEAELFALPSQEMVAQLGPELKVLRDGDAA